MGVWDGLRARLVGPREIEDLPSVPRPPETEHERAMLLEIYLEYVRQTAITTEQRQSANRFFLGLNSAIGAGYAFLAQSPQLQETRLLPLLMAVAALLGVLLCRRWRRRILNYAKLLSAKFDVLHEMERHLPAQPYLAEYPKYQRLGRFSDNEGAFARSLGLIHGLILLALLGASLVRCDPTIAPAGLCGGMLDVWGVVRPGG